MATDRPGRDRVLTAPRHCGNERLGGASRRERLDRGTMGRALATTIAAVAVALAVTCDDTLAGMANPLSDAPEPAGVRAAPFKDAPSYAEALRTWKTAEDVNDWIGARFTYDMARAILLSETQRGNGRLPIRPPDEFFADPSGVCVDLSRFGVETLRAIAPQAGAGYLMIEFAPLSVAGNVLRRHWIASFRQDGKLYFFADSKRPGHIAGPYDSAQQFLDEYAVYRGRQIVAFREVDTYERRRRVAATRKGHAEHPATTGR